LLPPAEELECQEEVRFSVTTVIIVVVFAGLIMILGGIGTAYLWWKNKQTYEMYTQLKNSHIPMETEVYIHL
jgi:hypothetical protein